MSKRKAKKIMIPADLQSMAFDWKEFSSDAAVQIEEVLATFGIKMYDDPAFDGSDTYGFMLTKSTLTKAQVEAISKVFAEE